MQINNNIKAYGNDNDDEEEDIKSNFVHINFFIINHARSLALSLAIQTEQNGYIGYIK